MTEQHWRKRQTKMIDVASIKIEDRILKPSKARVAAMAKSLSSDLGQLNPILVTRHLMAWRVVAGATRLMAAQELDWDQIEATIIGADNDYDYKLIEIGENIERHDLSETERKRLKDMQRELRAARLTHFEKLAAGDQPEVPPKKAKGGRGKKGGVADAARKAGVSRSTARDRMKAKAGGNTKPPALDIDAPSSKKSPDSPAAPAPEPQREPAPQAAASAEPAAPDRLVKCPWCRQGMVTPEEAEAIPVGPQFDATETRH